MYLTITRISMNILDVVRFTPITDVMNKCSSSTHKLRSDVKQIYFHTECYFCGEMVDQEKIKRHPNNKYFEFSRVVLLQVKATIIRRCSERRASTVDE